VGDSFRSSPSAARAVPDKKKEKKKKKIHLSNQNFPHHEPDVPSQSATRHTYKYSNTSIRSTNVVGKKRSLMYTALLVHFQKFSTVKMASLSAKSIFHNRKKLFKRTFEI